MKSGYAIKITFAIISYPYLISTLLCSIQTKDNVPNAVKPTYIQQRPALSAAPGYLGQMQWIRQDLSLHLCHKLLM